MTRERYLEIRNEELQNESTLNVNLLFEFAIDLGYKGSMGDFLNLASSLHSIHPYEFSHYLSNIRDMLYDEYDIKFEIVYVYTVPTQITLHYY